MQDAGCRVYVLLVQSSAPCAKPSPGLRLAKPEPLIFLRNKCLVSYRWSDIGNRMFKR